MDISLITSEESFSNNYGAALQGYALSCSLTKMGTSVKIIRYKGSDPNGLKLKFRIRTAISGTYHRIFMTPEEK